MLNSLRRQPRVIILPPDQNIIFNAALRHVERYSSGKDAAIQQRWDERKRKILRQSLQNACSVDAPSHPRKM